MRRVRDEAYRAAYAGRRGRTIFAGGDIGAQDADMRARVSWLR